MAENKTLEHLPEVRAAVAALSPENREVLAAVQVSPFKLTAPEQFKEFAANIDYFVFEPNIHDLNDLGWRYLAQHMDMLLPPELLKAIDPVPFGKYAMQEEQGHFTELLSDPLAQLAFLSHDLWIEISLHRQAADFYKLNDNRQAGDRALVFNVGKIPGINIHLFG